MSRPLQVFTFDTASRRVGAMLVATLAVLVASIAGCGGSVGTGGTGAYVVGPVSGFGSVIVAGVRFDDSAARVEDDDGTLRSRDDLRLGMMVEIDSGAIAPDGSGGAQATATRVRFASELIGPVTSIDPATARLTVLGQPVRVTASTVFDAALTGGLAALANGDVVEVYGFFDAAGGGYSATRIERRSNPPTLYRVRGVVRELDNLAQTLRIGAQLFDYRSALSMPANLDNGQFVRLRVAAAPVAGRWVVSAFGAAPRMLDDRDEAEVEGLVSAFTSATQFRVNGVTVDASGAAFPDGSAGLALGVRVEVKGSTRAGVLVASTVEIKTDDEVRIEGFDLRGTIDSVNPAATTFALRGLTVFYGNAPRFDGGSAADLVAGRKLRVRGTLSADRTRIDATRIEFEN